MEMKIVIILKWERWYLKRDVPISFDSENMTRYYLQHNMEEEMTYLPPVLTTTTPTVTSGFSPLTVNINDSDDADSVSTFN